MARLRSATVASTPRTDPAPDPATPGAIKPAFSRITEQSSKLNAIIERQTTPDRRSPQHLDSVLNSVKNTPLSPPSAPDERLYPSLDSVLERNVNTTPRMSKSKIPASVKKAGVPMTPMKGGTPAPFKVPEGEGGFGFKFSSGLAMQGRKLLNGLTGKKTPAAPPAVPPSPMAVPATPSKMAEEQDEPDTAPRGSQTEPRPLKKKKRFSDIHRQQFAKMDSITTHYAAKRVTPNHSKVSDPPSDITPKNTVQTPEMAPKGIKRSKSQAVLSEREIPVSPSPVKVQQPRAYDDDDRESPVKRQKLDPSTATLKRKPTKIARFAAGTSTPMKSAAGRSMGAPNTVAAGVLGKGLFLKAPSSSRRMPALPKPVSTLNLTPATTLSATTSKIPTTPGRTPSFRPTRGVPGTVGGSKLNTMINFAEAVSSSPDDAATADPDLTTINLSTPARGNPKTVGGFTFRSRGSGLGFGALTEIHQKKTMEMPKFSGGMGTPKVTENDPVGVEDPFAGVLEDVSKGTWEEKSEDIGWAIGATPIVKPKTNKRKESHPDDELEEEDQVMEDVRNLGAPTPARKKLRFATSSGQEEPSDEEDEEEKKPQTLAEAVAKANRKRRLNQLATPKKRAAGEGDRLGRRSAWK